MGSFGCVWTVTTSSLATIRSLSSSRTTTLTAHWDAINAYAVQIQIGGPTTTAASTGNIGSGKTAGSKSGTATGTASGASSSNSSTPGNGTTLASSSSGGLSSGAKAGIGIGVALGALILIGLAFFLGYRRAKRKFMPGAPVQKREEIQSSRDIISEAASHPISEAPDSPLKTRVSELEGSTFTKSPARPG
jgi:hypothetical protein